MGESQTLLKSHTWLHNSFVTLKQIRESFGCEQWSQKCEKDFCDWKKQFKTLLKKKKKERKVLCYIPQRDALLGFLCMYSASTKYTVSYMLNRIYY